MLQHISTERQLILVLGKFDKAIVDLSKAIQLNPDYATAYGNRGAAYVGKGEVNQAIKDYTKSIQLNPDDAGVYSNRGTAYNIKGDFDSALQDLNKAIELRPNGASVYNNRAMFMLTKAKLTMLSETITPL